MSKQINKEKQRKAIGKKYKDLIMSTYKKVGVVEWVDNLFKLVEQQDRELAELENGTK